MRKKARRAPLALAARPACRPATQRLSRSRSAGPATGSEPAGQPARAAPPLDTGSQWQLRRAAAAGHAKRAGPWPWPATGSPAAAGGGHWHWAALALPNCGTHSLGHWHCDWQAGSPALSPGGPLGASRRRRNKGQCGPECGGAGALAREVWPLCGLAAGVAQWPAGPGGRVGV